MKSHGEGRSGKQKRLSITDRTKVRGKISEVQEQRSTLNRIDSSSPGYRYVCTCVDVHVEEIINFWSSLYLYAVDERHIRRI